jgi:hypothetical protein
MIYVLFPHAGERDDVRIFTSFSHVEQEALRMAQLRKGWGVDPDWCAIYAYEGVDELKPYWGYFVHSSMVLKRYPLSPSPSGS